MAPETGQDVALEIGHVLFIDIVGYSKRTIDDPRFQKLVNGPPPKIVYQ
jgi:hypothetical protein